MENPTTTETNAGAATVKRRHPWSQKLLNEIKLKAARKEARRRKYIGDPYKERKRDQYRMKHGIPLDAPVMSLAESARHAASCRKIYKTNA